MGAKISLKLTKEESTDIGFAEECLMAGAITQEEFKIWVLSIIEAEDDIPPYLFDLIDLKDLRQIFKGPNGPIGFLPNSKLLDVESKAIDGIAIKRGLVDNLVYDSHLSKGKALEALSNNEHIEQKFKTLFPFIAFL